MKLVKLRDKSQSIGFSPHEAIEEAMKTDFNKSEILIVIYDSDSNSYEFFQGGTTSLERMLWHVEQVKYAILDERVET